MHGKRIACAALALLFLDGAGFCVTKPFEKVQLRLDNASTFPRGVRNIGMGGAGAAEVLGFSTGYFNPASFAWSDALALGASTSDFSDILEFWDARLSAGVPLKRTIAGAQLRLGGSLAFETRSLDIHCGSTIYVPEGTSRCGESHPDRCLSGSLAALARKGVLELAAGGTVKRLEVRDFVEYTTWAFDLGLIAAVEVKPSDRTLLRPRFGASARNLGKDIEIDLSDTSSARIDQPREFRLGFGFDAFSPPVDAMTRILHRDVPLVAVSFDYDIVGHDGSSQDDGWAFGAEMSWFRLLSLRAGMSENVFLGSDASTLGVGLGWDFGRVLVQIDYARIDRSCDLCDFLGIDTEDDSFGLVIGGRL